ncbi:MAG: hypothetical protein GXY83_34660 [Rhodopirellula sp.]|nr:hypothetical protein [Rhodopirellula sp.]
MTADMHCSEPSTAARPIRRQLRHGLARCRRIVPAARRLAQQADARVVGQEDRFAKPSPHQDGQPASTGLPILRQSGGVGHDALAVDLPIPPARVFSSSGRSPTAVLWRRAWETAQRQKRAFGGHQVFHEPALTLARKEVLPDAS